MSKKTNLSFVALTGPAHIASRRSVAPAARSASDYSPEVSDAIVAIDQAGREHENLTADEAIALLHSWM